MHFSNIFAQTKNNYGTTQTNQNESGDSRAVQR